MQREIVQKDDAGLRDIAKPVDIQTLPHPEITSIVTDMSDTLQTARDGVAIAAPQVGEPLRIFIVNHKLFGDDVTDDKVFINPEITKQSKETLPMGEGCLSVHGTYGRVVRSVKATVRAYDEYGNQFELGGSGLMAQIFQHEIDHLNGILYIDKAESVQEVTSE